MLENYSHLVSVGEGCSLCHVSECVFPSFLHHCQSLWAPEGVFNDTVCISHDLMGQRCSRRAQKGHCVLASLMKGANGHLYHVAPEAAPSSSSRGLISKQLWQVLPCIPLTGCHLSKPEVIFRLEQGEELWPSEGRFPDQRDQGELVIVEEGRSPQKSGLRWVGSEVGVCLCNSILGPDLQK